MMKLTEVTIHKFKSILKPQKFSIDPKVTTIVGMNESGKTGLLTAIAKTNYFDQDDPDFQFDLTHDFPRSELIDFQESNEDWKIITCKYQICSELLAEIASDIGQNIFTETSFEYTKSYSQTKKTVGGLYVGINASTSKFLNQITKNYDLSESTKKTILLAKKIQDVLEVPTSENDVDLEKIKLKVNFIIQNSYPWSNLLEGYIAKQYISPKLPKFWYFDDYYPLKSKININNLSQKNSTDESDKTSKALFDLAKINPKDIVNNGDYEKFIAQLEASSNKITKEIFKYWSANTNLSIDFKIQDITTPQGVPNKLLDIRVKNHRHQITLPLDRRSKGFNWFFSFIVWFSKIQADHDSNYILLLDEPGLNLHASAQADLIKFIDDLGKNYQVIYTTHSPFMVETGHLDRVRTCYETDNGTIVSDSIQEKDPNTLFPLQAALGYDIAQNLFVSKNNLLVEGPADLIYLTLLSSILESENRTGIKEGVTIVPVGGLDKVSTFISLLRGSKLNVACLLDSFTDQKGKQKVNDLISAKIIKDKNIRFFDEFTETNVKTADIEDLFTPSEYLLIFNEAFKGEFDKLEVEKLDDNIPTMIGKINKAINKDRFNHYRPANKLNSMGVDAKFFSENTLKIFESMFKEINKLF